MRATQVIGKNIFYSECDDHIWQTTLANLQHWLYFNPILCHSHIKPMQNSALVSTEFALIMIHLKKTAKNIEVCTYLWKVTQGKH